MVQIRQAVYEDAEGIAFVHVNSWRTTYKGVVSDNYLKELNIETRMKNWQKNFHTINSCVFVAEDESGNIVGFASGGPEQTHHPKYYRTGEVYAIYLLESFQRKGIGKQLIKAILDHLDDLGLEQLLIWALEDNSYRLFYEQIGGSIIETTTIEIDKKQLIEIGYGWDSIKDLRSQLIE